MFGLPIRKFSVGLLDLVLFLNALEIEGFSEVNCFPVLSREFKKINRKETPKPKLSNILVQSKVL